MKSAFILFASLVAFVGLSQQGTDARRLSERGLLDELLLRRLEEGTPYEQCMDDWDVRHKHIHTTQKFIADLQCRIETSGEMVTEVTQTYIDDAFEMPFE